MTYSALSNWWYVTGGSSTLGVGFNSLNWTNPAFGEAALRLQDGLQYNHEDLYHASYDPGIRPSPGQLNVPPAWGAQINDPNGGRPARINQWNISVQRELFKNVIAEVSYLGNRGVWLEANNLVSHNATPLTRFQELGLDLNNAGRPDAAHVADRFCPRGVARVQGALRRIPGQRDRRADAPAVPAVQRRPRRPVGAARQHLVRRAACQSHASGSGIGSISPRRSRGRRNGPWAAAAIPSAGGGPINNVFDRAAQKGLAANSQPFIFVTSFNYRDAAASRQGRRRAARRLDVRGPPALLQRLADCRPRGAEQSLLARLPEHAHEPRRRPAAVPEGSQLQLHRPARRISC